VKCSKRHKFEMDGVKKLDSNFNETYLIK